MLNQELFSKLRPLFQKYAFILIAIPIVAFLYHLIVDQYIPVRKITMYFLILGVIAMAAKKWLSPSWQLLVFCVTATAVYGLNYYVLGKMDPIPPSEFKQYKFIITQYIWLVPLIVLPSIYGIFKFRSEHFFWIITIGCLFLLVFVNYHNIRLHFNRDILAEYFDPIIPYNICMMSVAVLMMFYAFTKTGKWFYLLFLIAVLTVFSIALQGSRGTWLGIPFVLALLVGKYYKQHRQKFHTILAVFCVLLPISLFIPNSPILSRLDVLYSDYQNINADSYQNSSGTRLVLWGNALKQFEQHPLDGAGIYAIQESNCQLQQQGKIPRCFRHDHNIVFHEMASNGLLGLLGLLLTFASALVYFLRHLKHTNMSIQHLALTGIGFLGYYFISGLTEYYLFFPETTFWFYLVIASLMAFIQVQSSSSPNSTPMRTS